MSSSTITILKRTDCQFLYEVRGETYLKVRLLQTLVGRHSDTVGRMKPSAKTVRKAEAEAEDPFAASLAVISTIPEKEPLPE